MENLKYKYFGLIIGVNTVKSALFMGAAKFMDFVGQHLPKFTSLGTYVSIKVLIRSILHL